MPKFRGILINNTTLNANISSCKVKILDSNVGFKFNLYKLLNKTQLPIKLLFLYILQAVCSKTNLYPNETRRTIEIKFLNKN